MVNTQPSYRHANQDPVTIRALSSITSEQADAISAAVHANGAWTVQTFDDYDGYLSILIEPSTIGHETTFFISGKTHCIELVRTQEDRMASIGTYADVEELQARLTDLFRIQ